MNQINKTSALQRLAQIKLGSRRCHQWLIIDASSIITCFGFELQILRMKWLSGRILKISFTKNDALVFLVYINVLQNVVKVKKKFIFRKISRDDSFWHLRDHRVSFNCCLFGSCLVKSSNIRNLNKFRENRANSSRESLIKNQKFSKNSSKLRIYHSASRITTILLWWTTRGS